MRFFPLTVACSDEDDAGDGDGDDHDVDVDGGHGSESVVVGGENAQTTFPHTSVMFYRSQRTSNAFQYLYSYVNILQEFSIWQSPSLLSRIISTHLSMFDVKQQHHNFT